MQSDSITKSQDASKLIVDFIANIPLFDDLEMHELEFISRHMELLDLEEGQTLYDEWDKGDFVCFVEKGILEVLKKTGANTYIAVGSLRRGRSIGEMSIIDNYPRSATLRAQTASRVVTFSRRDFELILGTNQKIGIKLLKGLSRLLGHNLRKASSRLTDYLMPMG